MSISLKVEHEEKLTREKEGENQTLGSKGQKVKGSLLTLSQATNFRLFKTEGVCRRQFKM